MCYYLLHSALFLFITIHSAHAFIEGLYCGKENCYTVLGVTRDASKSLISKAYRQLAKKYHPDMHKGSDAKREAATKFRLIATAYEVLKDEDSRRDYDDLLDNPEAIYRHYYHYYRRRVAPKVDIRIVLAVTITVISVVQYYGAWYRYTSALDYLVTQPKYRNRASEIAKERGLLNAGQNGKKRDRRPKEVIREEEETILKQIIAEQVDIRGGYSPPSVRNTLWLQLVCFPYYFAAYLFWWIRWMYKFNILREEYGDEEKWYLIRKNMGVSSSQFDAIPDEEKDTMFKKELWDRTKYRAWKAKKDEELRLELATNARYKSYRRYMKNHGPGTITFDD